MSKLMVKDGDIWVPMEGLKGDTGPLPADESIPDTALVTDGAKTNTAYLMHNRLTKDAEGELISVEDAYAVPPVSFGADGVSTQVSTTGKNLLSDVPTEWVKRTFSGLSGTHVSFPISIEDGASYYYINTTGTGMSPGMYAGFCDTLEGEITVYDRVTMTNYNSRTFTNTDNHPYLVFFAAGANTTAAQLTNQFKSYKIFLSVNSSDTYEVYSGGAASPRPDWPQEISSIDYLEIGFSGINLFDILKVNTSIHTVDGTTITSGGTETYRDLYSGAVYTSSTTFTAAQMSKMLYLPAGTYRVIYTPVTGSTVRVAGIYVNPSTGKPITDSLFFTAGGGVSFRMPNDGYLVVAIRYNNTTIKDLQISPRTTAYPYTPFTGFSIATLNISNEPLRSLPDGTKDELYLTYIRPSTRPGWAYYRGEKVERVGCVDMGMLNWAYWYSKFYAVVPNCINQPNINQKLSNYYASGKIVAIAISVDSIDEGVVYSRSTYPHVIIKDTAYTNATEFKEHVNGRLLLYPLRTPETIDLGIFELPAMQSGITNLWSDPSTNLSVTYERDRNIVITSLKAAVADLATS